MVTVAAAVAAAAAGRTRIPRTHCPRLAGSWTSEGRCVVTLLCALCYVRCVLSCPCNCKALVFSRGLHVVYAPAPYLVLLHHVPSINWAAGIWHGSAQYIWHGSAHCIACVHLELKPVPSVDSVSELSPTADTTCLCHGPACLACCTPLLCTAGIDEAALRRPAALSRQAGCVSSVACGVLYNVLSMGEVADASMDQQRCTRWPTLAFRSTVSSSS